MKIIITDMDSSEEETVTLKAPRQEEYLSSEDVRGRREFAIDAVILEGLKFIANRDTSPRFIALPNSLQNPRGCPTLSDPEREAVLRTIFCDEED